MGYPKLGDMVDSLVIAFIKFSLAIISYSDVSIYYLSKYQIVI